jgi:hypothetical protein
MNDAATLLKLAEAGKFEELAKSTRSPKLRAAYLALAAGLRAQATQEPSK